MGRTVQDVALLLSAIAGSDPRAPIAIAEPGAGFGRPLGRDFAGVRLAWSRDFGGRPVDPAVTAVLEGQRGTFEALGCRVEDADPGWEGADAAFKAWRAWLFEASYGPLLPEHRAQMKETVIWNIEAGQRLTGPELARAELGRTRLFQLCSPSWNATELT
jgi:amidase